VEKAMGYYESRLAVVLIGFLEAYLVEHDLGIVLGADGLVRMEPGQVRLPDVCFFAWEKFPNRQLPRAAILDRRPDLAVEILSPSNTRAEMARKRREYFAGGARLVWEVDPEARRVRVYTDAETFTELGEDGTLDGGPVLPGFALPVRRWFERAGERAEP
jgi:Uma2 family endonuclease